MCQQAVSVALIFHFFQLNEHQRTSLSIFIQASSYQLDQPRHNVHESRVFQLQEGNLAGMWITYRNGIEGRRCGGSLSQLEKRCIAALQFLNLDEDGKIVR